MTTLTVNTRLPFNDLLFSLEQLTPDELSRLVEYAMKLKWQSTSRQDMLEAMANDPEIQQELQQIEAEFSVADFDGLG